MAFQSQTYSNSNNGYYVVNQAPINPNHPTALATPVEFLDAIGPTGPTQYYSMLAQNDTYGMSLTERSTITGPIIGLAMNPNGTRGQAGQTGPQFYIGINGNETLVMTSSLTEVFGTFAVGSITNPGDVNALTINYSSIPFPNSAIKQTGQGVDQTIELDLFSNISSSNPLIDKKSGVVIRNPDEIIYPGNSAVITNSAILIQQPTGLAPQASMSFLAGQATFTATTSNKSITMMADSGGNGSIQADGSLALKASSPAVIGLLINTDGTTEVPLKMYGPEVSTIVTTTSTIKSNYSATAKDTITNQNGSSQGNYQSGYNNYQGQLVYNTLRNNYSNPDAPPVTAFESLEIVNVSGGPQTGGIQFYTSNNGAPLAPKWMGGFLENNTGSGVSEFRLASTVQASMTQITNVSTLNNVSLTSFGNPVGTIINFAAWNPPVGYLRCDGASYAKSAYPALYSVIGNTYGEDTLNFAIPDCLGKTMMGALSAYSGPNSGQVAAYTASAVFQGLVTGVSNPFGTTSTGLFFSSSNRPVTQGMLCQQSDITASSYIVQYVVGSDGRLTGPNRGFLVMLLGDVTAVNPFVIMPGTSVSFFPNPSMTVGQNYPKLGDENPQSIGVGTMSIWQDASQVGAHTHPQSAGGGGGTTTFGSANPIQGSQTGVNNTIFAYTAPAYGGLPAIGVAAPRTMYSLPYNLGVTMCIKY